MQSIPKTKRKKTRPLRKGLFLIHKHQKTNFTCSDRGWGERHFLKQTGQNPLQMKNQPQVKAHLEENQCQISTGGYKCYLHFLANI